MKSVSSRTSHAVVGSDPVGAGWAARFLAYGLEVVAYAPARNTERKIRAELEVIWPSMQKLGLMPGASLERLRFVDDLEEIGATASFIQLNEPDGSTDEPVRQAQGRGDLLRELDAAAPPHVIIATSSARLPDPPLADLKHPERLVVGRPVRPVYLLPLVEVIGDEKTSEESLEKAIAFYRSVGMHPLRPGQGWEATIAYGLQAGLWREAQNMVSTGMATAEEIDEALMLGPALRWAIEGARSPVQPAGKGSAAGNRPELSIQQRDECLIDLMRALRPYRVGAGRIIAQHETRRYTGRRHTRWTPGAEIERPLALYECPVDPNLIDYNGHMTESGYLAVFGDASDALFRYVGIDEAYRAAGRSFYTVESHINYYREVSSGEPLRFTTQLLGLDEKRLHFFHTMVHGTSGKLLATTEQMLVHVDMAASAASPIDAKVYRALSAIMAAHREMDLPKQVGRQMAIGGGKD